MKKIFTAIFIIAGIARPPVSKAQLYRAPQDTAKIKRSPTESLTTYSTGTRPITADSRLLGCAIKAAALLKDTLAYDTKKGIALERLFTADDLRYIAAQGAGGAVALFDLINQNLPKGHNITFKTAGTEIIVTGKNPLVLENLRAGIANNPATVTQPQWKENVYQGYIARDYGTKLFNTITITAATTEIQQSQGLEIIDFDNRPITLAKIRSREKTEQAAVLNFREHTFPNPKISETNARENYRRALFELMRLQENNINQNPESQQLLASLTADLKMGPASQAIRALKNSSFFNNNVKESIGPVLLTESEPLNADEIAGNAREKAMGIFMLVSLHYGERDAIKLFKQLINGKGSLPAQYNGFSVKRVKELTDHGAEQFKSLGFREDKTDNMTSADLVLVAVSSPAVMPRIQPDAYLGMINQVSQSIVNQYTTITEETTITKNTLLFNPRISLGSRHIEYRAGYDPIDFVPQKLPNGEFFDQRGSRITQNGVELRLESDIYFSNSAKLISKGVKPVIYPEFGILLGVGNRKVGYDQSTTVGPLGAVPQFQLRYNNWGAHLGLNVGPVLIATDATILTTPVADDARKRFFDLSQGMTYYRYELLTHILNYGLKNDLRLTLDLDLVGETNNEGFGNLTSTQGTDAQIQSAKWYQDYDRVHPGGVYDQALATTLLNNGYVKASYPASNFGAFIIGVQKWGFKLSGTAGLYNIHTRTGYQIYDNLLRNTLRGNFFGAMGLTYNFGFKSLTTKSRKKDTYSSTDNVHHTDETSTKDEAKTGGPRNHAIFTNKK